jgi:S-adenosylmethionine:tRNA ribosyltransferase-isomerase
MDISLFDYDLPPDLIAQEPAELRDAARLLVLDRLRGTWRDHRFSDLPALLRPGDCLVANESRVIAARLFGSLEPSGHSVEVLLLRPAAEGGWEALVRPGKRCRAGARIRVGGDVGLITILDQGSDGMRRVAVEAPWPVPELLERHGLPPLPPYITRYDAPKPEDRARYQTIYARCDGSVAAPTAGLHFTLDLFTRLQSMGVEAHYLALHVGIGTFRPVRAASVEAHHMASEEVDVPASTADAVNRARAEGRRVIAVGTTSTRALEWAADDAGRVRAGPGAADLFIRPGHRFKVVDGLITNFHLPRSTLLLLVSAFCGRERTLAAYGHAVAAGYRFYSYGDAMLIA